jgi:fructose-specific phosphotransferase system IIC component
MTIKSIIILIGAAAVAASMAAAQSVAPGVVAVTPEEMKWGPQGSMALPGLE